MIEAVVMAKAIARERQFLVRHNRRHDACASLVGMLGNPAHQRQRDRGRGQQHILSLPQLKPDLDGHLGEAVEFDGIDQCGKIALLCCHGTPRVAELICNPAILTRNSAARCTPRWQRWAVRFMNGTS